MAGQNSARLATDDDVGLARRIGERDERAFEVLMRAHNRLLFRLARSILNDDSDAEDAVQDAYLAAYRNIGSFGGRSKLSTWLARIVINEAYARLRRRKRSGVVVPLEAVARHDERGESRGEEEAMADEKVERPEAAAQRAELRRLLEARIGALPEQFRTVFILRDVEELSVEETAECLDLPPATVRTRAFRARAMLRESLSRDIDTATVNAFGFDGERCDRIVSRVLARLGSETAAARRSTLSHDRRTIMKLHGITFAAALLGAAGTALGQGAAAPTDPQIAHIVVTANQVDIDAGKLAESKGHSKEVKDFGKMMATDHSGVNKQATALVTKLKVKPEDNATSESLKKGGADNLAKLKGLSGDAFDKAYIEHEVVYHQQVLDAVDKVLVPNAKNEELKALIIKVRPAFVAHLEHAKMIQGTLGKS